MKSLVSRFVIAASLAGAGIGPVPALAADHPRPTLDLLARLKLGPEVLKGLEDDLKVPEAWIRAAEKEGPARINGSWTRKEGEMMNVVFRARYPKVKVQLVHAGAFNERAIKPLIAFKEGRYVVDSVSGFGGSSREYVRAGALEDMRSLPSFNNALLGNEPNGLWAGIRLRYWCMAYNTKVVDKAQLPKTWSDILTNTYWHNGRLGVTNRPQLWLAMMSSEYGLASVTKYMDRFFEAVKPQYRKEGLSAVVSLVVAGEFAATLPAGPASVKVLADKGAPVAWHCPDLVPTAVSTIGILKNNPRPYGTRIWVNWLMSREGQIAQFAADRTSPIHRGLQDVGLVVYAEELKGKKVVAEDTDNMEALHKAWDERWIKLNR
ncbi:MAG: hypothetical protein RL477_174 [Pseudomonadota bacterium]|jgi:iron(III) transport system substrate-binding protein